MGSRNTAAAALIALNAAIEAATFLWVAQIVTDTSVLGAAVWLLLGAAAGAAAVLAVIDPGTLTHRQFWRCVHRHLGDRDFVLYTGSRLDWPLVAAASSLIGGLPTAIITGTQNLIFIPLLQKMTSSAEGERWRRVGPQRFLLVAVAFVGAALALAAQHNQQASSNLGAGVAITVAGAVTAAAAAVCAALSAARFPLAIRIHQRLALPGTGHTKELAPMLLVHGVACVAAAAVLCAAFGVPGLDGAPAAAAAGAVAITSGFVTRSLGCLLATDLSVNAIAYATPLAAFGLFAVTGAASQVNMPMIAAATVMIVGSNAALTVTTRAQR